MKKKQFESLCKKLLPNVPGFNCKGWLLYAHPVGHVLRGFCCDGSGFDSTKFTVEVFCLPLYVPTNHIYFLFGDRLRDERGCEIWWDVNDPKLADDLLFRIKAQGIPFLTAIQSPNDLVEAAQKLPPTQEARKWETIAYSLAMANEYNAAQLALDRLVKAFDVNIPWHIEMMERAKQLGEKLKTDAQGAKELLVEWQQATMKNLGLC